MVSLDIYDYVTYFQKKYIVRKKQVFHDIVTIITSRSVCEYGTCFILNQ